MNNRLDDNVINFFYNKKEYQSLSNFSLYEIIINDRVYTTGEHCFHGEKYTLLGLESTNSDRANQLLSYGKIFQKNNNNLTALDVKKKVAKKAYV